MRLSLFTSTAAMLLATSAQATIIFDEYQSGVTWDADWGGVNTTNTYAGAQSIQANTDNGQIVFIPPAPSRTPLTIGAENILDFYVNTTTSAPIEVMVRISTPTKTIEYDWGGAPFYEIDGASVAGKLATDGDASTWQHVKFDVAQAYDFWGASGTEFTNLTATDQISKIMIIGSSNTLVDNIQLTAVPEPAALGLLGLSGLMVLRRRRA